MTGGAGERVLPGYFRITRYPQDSRGGDEEVEGLLAVGGGEPPLPVVVPGAGDGGAEPDVRTYTPFVGHLPEVRVSRGQVGAGATNPGWAETSRSNTARGHRR